MRSIFRTFGTLLLTILAIYGFFLAATLIVYPPSREHAMDTRDLTDSLFINEPRYIVWNRAPLATPSSKIVFIGSSNFRNSIILNEIRQSLPDFDLHNLTAGSANIGMMGRAVELAEEAIPSAARSRTVFVIGILFGNFNDDRRAWNGLPSPLDRELVRFGLYEIEGQSLRNIVPVWLIPWLDIGLRPYLALARLRYTLLTPAAAPPPPSSQRESDDDRFREANLLWTKLLGTNDALDETPFNDLASIAKRIVGHGSHLVIVEMPVAAWFGARSPFYANYQKHRAERLGPILGLNGVHYIDLQAVNDPDLFSDSTHPNVNGATQLSNMIAVRLRQMIDTEIIPIKGAQP